MSDKPLNAAIDGWHTMEVKPHLIGTQWASGGTNDFIDSASYITSSTSFLVLALSAGLPAR